MLERRGEPADYLRIRPFLLAAWRRQSELPSTRAVRARMDTLLDPLAPPEGIQVLGHRGEPYQPGAVPWWWLPDPPPAWDPASDRVERAVLAYLRAEQRPGALTDTDVVIRAVTLELPLACAPDRPWLETLLSSYGAHTDDGGLRVRPQDQPQARQRELDSLAHELLAMGRRFGFAAAIWNEEGLWNVDWQREGERRASFLLTATTSITPRMWRSRAPLPGLARFLVLPGGRARAGTMAYRSPAPLGRCGRGGRLGIRQVSPSA